jgi:amino acid transporter
MAAIFVTVESPYTAFTSYIAGEVKKAESGLRQHFFVETAALFQGIVFMLFGWAWISMAGLEFLAALAHSGSLGLPIDILYWSRGTVEPVLGTLIAALFVLSIFLTWQLPSMAKLTAISRCVFAWSFDRVFPPKLSHVSDKYKTPTYAIWGTWFVTMIMLLLWATAGDVIWTYIAACVFWGLLNLMIVAIAGVIFPYIRKDMFEVMPLKGRIGKVPILTIISALGLALTLWSTTSYYRNPEWTASYGVTPVTIGTSAFIYALGLIIPQISRAYWKRKGIDLDIAFKQIPPA